MGLLFSRLNDNRNELSYDEKYTLYAELYEASMEFDQNVAYCDYETLSLIESADYDEYGIMTEASLKGAWETIKKWWNKFIGLLKKWWNKLKRWVKSIFSDSSTSSTEKKAEKAEEKGALIVSGGVDLTPVTKQEKIETPVEVEVDPDTNTATGFTKDVKQIGYTINMGYDGGAQEQEEPPTPPSDRPQLPYNKKVDFFGEKSTVTKIVFPIHGFMLRVANQAFAASDVIAIIDNFYTRACDLHSILTNLIKFGKYVTDDTSSTIVGNEVIKTAADRFNAMIGDSNSLIPTTLSKDQINNITTFIKYMKTTVITKMNELINKYDECKDLVNSVDKEILNKFTINSTNFNAKEKSLQNLLIGDINVVNWLKSQFAKITAMVEKDKATIDNGLTAVIRL